MRQQWWLDAIDDPQLINLAPFYFDLIPVAAYEEACVIEIGGFVEKPIVVQSGKVVISAHHRQKYFYSLQQM